MEPILGFEGICIKMLLLEYNEDDIIVNADLIPIIWYNKLYADGKIKRGRFFPDMKLPDKLIEVKSVYTYEVDKRNNDEKFIETARQGYRLEVWIFRDKRRLSERRLYTKMGKAVVIFVD